MKKQHTALPLSQEEFGQSIYSALFPSDNGVVNDALLQQGFKLRPTQVTTIEHAAYALMGLESRQSGGSGLFRLPPRTGKTVSFGTLSKLASDQGVRSVILVPSMGLVDQTYGKLTEVCGHNPHTGEIGMYHGETSPADRQKALDANVLITTYDSFLNLVQSGDITPQNRPFLILDEAHHAMGDARKAVIKDFMQQGALVHAWTATDMKADGNHVSEELFENDPPVMSKTIPETVMDGETTPIRNIVFQTDLESGVQSKQGEFSDNDAEKVVAQAGRNEAAVKKIMGSIDVVEYQGQKKNVHFANVPQIWYTAGRENAQALAEELNTQYAAMRNTLPAPAIVPETYAVAIDGNTPMKERERIFKDYADGKIRTLVSADLLIEGYDFPNCELTVMLRPTRSPRIALQAGARSCALDPNNPAKIGYVASFIDRDSRDVAIFGHYAGSGWIAPEHGPLQSVGYKTLETGGANKTPREHGELPEVGVYYDQIEEIEFSGQKETHAPKPAKLEAEPQPIRVTDGWENITNSASISRSMFADRRTKIHAKFRETIKTNPAAVDAYSRMEAHEHGAATALKEAIAGDHTAQKAWEALADEARACRRFEEIYRQCENELKTALVREGGVDDADVRSKTFVTVRIMNKDYDIAAPKIIDGKETELFVRPKRHWNDEYIGFTKDQATASTFKNTVLRAIHAQRPYDFSSEDALYIGRWRSESALLDQHGFQNGCANAVLQQAINEYENHQLKEPSVTQKDRAPFTASNGLSVVLAKQNGRVPGYYFSDRSLAVAAKKAPKTAPETPGTVVTDYAALGRIAKRGVTIEHADGRHNTIRFAFASEQQKQGVQRELQTAGLDIDVGAAFSLRDKHRSATMEKIGALADALDRLHANDTGREAAA